VAVAARELGRAAEFANVFKTEANVIKGYGSYDELFNDEDVQVVYIGTITTTHYELALAAIIAGK